MGKDRKDSKTKGKRSGKAPKQAKHTQQVKKHKEQEHPSDKKIPKVLHEDAGKEPEFKASSKMKDKFAQKKQKSQFQLDPKLKNKNHQQKAKNWKDAAAAKLPKTSEEEQRAILRKTYSRIMENIKEPEKAKVFVEECMTLMKEEIAKYGFKRDGSHIVQACITYGSDMQIQRVKKACKGEFYTLMENKYGKYLAKKLYDSTFDEMEKKAVLEYLCGNMEKYMQHMIASEMIEHLYIKSKTKVKDKMFEAAFGAKLKFIKATEDIPDGSDIAKVFTDHPLIKDQIMSKLAQQIDTFVMKGLIRLTFVQKIVLFYVRHASQENLNKMLEEAHKNYLALLGSRDGLHAACILFVAADSKMRKHMVKQLRTETENLVDNMLISHLGTLFLLKVLLTMDDTILSCKMILDRVIELLPDLITNPAPMRMLGAICSEKTSKYYANDDNEVLSYSKFNTGKKDEAARKQEVIEHLMEGLKKSLPKLIPGNLNNREFCGFLTDVLSYIVKGHYEVYKEPLQAFIGAIERNVSLGCDQLVVDIIKHVAEEEDKAGKSNDFATEICRIINANLDAFLTTKGVFAIVKLLKIESTKKLLHSEILKKKARIEELAGTTGQNKGLKLVQEYLNNCSSST